MEDENYNDIACESALLDYETEKNESKVDYDFAGVDFGYPRTLEEVNAVEGITEGITEGISTNYRNGVQVIRESWGL